MIGMPNATFWQTPLADLTRQLDANANGLSSAEAAARLQRYGANRLEVQRRFSLLRKILSRFRNPLVLILLAAATVSAFTGDIASLVIISTMVLFSVLLDSVQEYRAEQAADQLKISVALKEQALRDGREITVRADQLVPGDVVVLAAGDLVPADGRVIEARDFFVNEALLTGESYPVEKRAVPDGIADVRRRAGANAAFMGTSVISGSARLLLCATGDRTQLGEISATLRQTPPPAALEKGVYEFGILIVRLTDTARSVRVAGEHVIPPPVAGELPVRHCARGRSDARTVADDRIGDARARRDTHGQAKSDREAPCRDP